MNCLHDGVNRNDKALNKGVTRLRSLFNSTAKGSKPKKEEQLSVLFNRKDFPFTKLDFVECKTCKNNDELNDFTETVYTMMLNSLYE